MIRLAPAIIYGLITILTLCLLFAVVTLPNASRWFQGSSASIQQDIIVLLENTTSLKSDSAFISEQWKYDKNLITADNTPSPIESGLQGLLYDRGLSCSSTVTNTLPFPLHDSAWKDNLTRIALIRLGGCLLMEKLKYAQSDGANAVIVYEDASLTLEDINGENSMNPSSRMHVDPNTIFIPTYYVDHTTGMELYERLENLTHWDNKTSSTMTELVDSIPSHVVTRVTLYPDQKPFLEPWQFALIVIGVVFFTTLMIVLGVQCHLCRIARKQRQQRRRRRRQQSMDDGQTLGDDDEEPQESFWLQLLSATTIEDDPVNEGSSHQRHEKKQRYRLHPSVLDILPTRYWDGTTEKDMDQCVICLESFELDNLLRILPCGHEYHQDCIDIWLTKKNACCPLCFQIAITLPTIPEQVHIGQQQQRQQDYIDIFLENNDSITEDRLEDTWFELANQRETTVRQHPSRQAHLRTPRLSLTPVLTSQPTTSSPSSSAPARQERPS
ncbi:uncharacterized protein BX664DRAFT_386085 [Halteromyces radiatus]|uniref:uncharacterized protein n=1 Tax=Halteromyces radiatus TaxID=101107 RepID=UPI00221EB3A5|nr:uncharacterized protein BX664DRAFT_386085 [Halteromyces radiatus]KAI8089625.1 hypothetical protein BX664DRAFT_386085 [Halteromyces radiatus]